MSKRPIVTFEAEVLFNGSKSGIGFYCYGLIDYLAQKYPSYQFVGFYYGKKDLSKIDLPDRNNISYKSNLLFHSKLVNLLRRLGVGPPVELLTRVRPAFIIFPAYLTLPSISKVPSTVMLHDLAFIDMPETLSSKNQSDLAKLVPKSIQNCSFITTISESTRQRIFEVYGKLDKEIAITHIPPAQPWLIVGSDKKNMPPGMRGGYILFIGNIEPRKNIAKLVEAYCSLVPEVRDKYALVLAGGSGWKDSAIKKMIRRRQREGFNIITTGYVTEKQKIALYMNATMFAFVSLYEGFGMPLLEAMNYKVPVLASDIKVFKEVAGDAVIYCDPENPSSITEKMQDMLLDESVRKNLSKKGSLKVREYDWNKSTKQFRQLMDSFISAQY